MLPVQLSWAVDWKVSIWFHAGLVLWSCRSIELPSHRLHCVLNDSREQLNMPEA